MSVREEVYNYLITVSTLTAYVGTRIFWVDDPEESNYPKVVFKEIDSPSLYQTDDQSQVWRFYILAEDRFACQAICDIIKEYLNRAYGTFGEEEIDFISHFNDQEMVLRDDNIFELISDYRVSYH